jgi:hypothetical protein
MVLSWHRRVAAVLRCSTREREYRLRDAGATRYCATSDLCHIDRREKEGVQELEIEHEAANYLKRSLICREESRTHSVRFNPDAQVRLQIHVHPTSRRAGKGVVASQQPRCLGESVVLDPDDEVAPWFVSAVVTKDQSRAGSCKERFSTQVWRDCGLPRIPQKTNSHLSFYAEPFSKVSGQANIYPVCIERAAEQIVAVVLITDSDLPWGIFVLTLGTDPAPG